MSVIAYSKVIIIAATIKKINVPNIMLILHSNSIISQFIIFSIPDGKFNTAVKKVVFGSLTQTASGLVCQFKRLDIISNAKGTPDGVPFVLARVDRKDAPSFFITFYKFRYHYNDTQYNL